MSSSWPWHSFGTFRFKHTEAPVLGTDRGWILTPTLARSRPLGSARDDIAVLSVGSMTREYEAIFEYDRFNTLRALINTAGVFTDNDRPSPGQQQAFLVNVEPLDRTISVKGCDVDGSHLRVRAKLSFVSQ